MGCHLPQSPHIVLGCCAPQCGQTPRVRKVSKGCPHVPPLHFSPSSGAVRQLGQANPLRRGNLASFSSTCACRSPPQQFISMKTAIAPIQKEWEKTARPKNPTLPQSRRNGKRRPGRRTRRCLPSQEPSPPSGCARVPAETTAVSEESARHPGGRWAGC